jgi:hypothetical protein
MTCDWHDGGMFFLTSNLIGGLPTLGHCRSQIRGRTHLTYLQMRRTSWSQQKAPVVDFIVVDVRRTDVDAHPISKYPVSRRLTSAIIRSHQAVIPGAINLPAQTFHPLLPMLTSLLVKIPIVIRHCSSSLGSLEGHTLHRMA